jgi:hypothetical protein
MGYLPVRPRLTYLLSWSGRSLAVTVFYLVGPLAVARDGGGDWTRDDCAKQGGPLTALTPLGCD